MAVMVVFSVHVCKLEDQYETHFREGEIWKISILQMARAFTSYFWQRREKERERVKFGGPTSCIFLGNQILFSVLVSFHQPYPDLFWLVFWKSVECPKNIIFFVLFFWKPKIYFLVWLLLLDWIETYLKRINNKEIT